MTFLALMHPLFNVPFGRRGHEEKAQLHRSLRRPNLIERAFQSDRTLVTERRKPENPPIRRWLRLGKQALEPQPTHVANEAKFAENGQKVCYGGESGIRTHDTR
jgi:hypothetical protein